MKSALLSVLLTGLVFTASGCSSQSSSASADIVARVNKKDITTAELDKQFAARVAGAAQPPTPEEAQDVKLQLLSQMINDQILLEMASQAGLTATDAEVDVKFNEFKNQYTEEQFKAQLEQQKMTVDDVRSELRKTITIDKLVNKEITSKISVSEAEINAFYEKNKPSFNLPEGYHIAHILITPTADPGLQNGKKDDAKTPEEAKQKALRVLKEVQGGMDFAVEAQNYSEDGQSAPNGGDLDFQPLEAIQNIDPKLAQAVQHLKVGETAAQPVETRYGYHIVKLLDHDAGGQKQISDPRVQAQVRQTIFNAKDQTLKAAFSETARNKAQVTNFFAQRILEAAGK